MPPSKHPPIPTKVIAVCGEIVADRSHTQINQLFMLAGASGDAPGGNRVDKVTGWLRQTNDDVRAIPLTVLGQIIQEYMEGELDPDDQWDRHRLERRKRLQNVLAECGLRYTTGGNVSTGVATPTQTLDDFIRDRNLPAVSAEFERANGTVDSDPREAVSAASNILESICKQFIDAESLDMPANKDLPSVWGIVRKHLGIDPSVVEEEDLRKIYSGLISVVQGVGSLRTHASSAHGDSPKSFALDPRHSRLAVHAAHTVAVYILETWGQAPKKKTATRPSWLR